MALADSFKAVVDALPDDWTDLTLDVRIFDEAGNDVQPGAIGEIYFRPTAGLGSTYHYIGAERRTRGEWKRSATSATSTPTVTCILRIVVQT